MFLYLCDKELSSCYLEQTNLFVSLRIFLLLWRCNDWKSWEFKYLRVLFDPQLSWDDHVNYLSSNISKRIGVILEWNNLPSKTVNMLAQALVFPHFAYCSSVWSNISLYHINELKFANRLARSLLSADIRTPVTKWWRTWIGINLLVDGSSNCLFKPSNASSKLHPFIFLQIYFHFFYTFKMHS